MRTYKTWAENYMTCKNKYHLITKYWYVFHYRYEEVFIFAASKYAVALPKSSNGIEET